MKSILQKEKTRIVEEWEEEQGEVEVVGENDEVVFFVNNDNIHIKKKKIRKKKKDVNIKKLEDMKRKG